jgi:hypothetical protein
MKFITTDGWKREMRAEVMKNTLTAGGEAKFLIILYYCDEIHHYRWMEARNAC